MDNDTRFSFAASSLIALGGIIGFITKQSLPSLVAGGGSGALLAYGVQRQRVNPRDVGLIIGISALLVVVMGMRFYRSRKFMPAGLVSLLSAALLYRFGQRLV